MRTTVRLRWAWMIGVGAFSMALPTGMLLIDPAVAAPPKPFLGNTKNVAAKSKPPAKDKDEDAEPADPAADKVGMVSLNHMNASWETVLKDFATATQTELVADNVPSKKFSRWDFKRHTKAEALKILNQELEPQNFRLQFKGRFLVLNQLREFRHEYPPAILRGGYRNPEQDAADEPGESSVAAGRAKGSAQKGSSGAVKQAGAQRSTNRGAAIRHAAADDDAETEAGRKPEFDPQPVPIETSVKLRTRDAGAVATHIYRAFNRQAERTDDGPQGLKGFHVRRLPGGKRDGETAAGQPVQFTIGVDKNRNELIVAGSVAESKSIIKVIKAMDNVPKMADGSGTAKIVRTKRDAGKLASALQPELTRLAQATRKTSRRAAQADEAAEGEEGDEQMPARRGARGNQSRDRGNENEEEGGERPLFGSLKADVLVESVPELGILVIRGNEADVDAVEKVIDEIERLSVQTAPRVKLALLRHISSEALASLLTTVYERLAGARNSAVQQSQAISVFPVSRPNAVLIVASNADIDSVFALIDELDQPSDPATEFMIYRLKHAIPSQVVDTVEALYPPQTQQQQAANQQAATVGLTPRVRVVEDLRTNSVIIQARPRDLREVADLIKELDKVDSGSTQQVKFFKLDYAVAEEVAATISTSLQRVLEPARATAAPGSILQGQQGQFGQQQQGAAGQGQSPAELRAVKMSILEFLDSEGAPGREIRSGILSDIRMTPDFRTNTIVVTAPRESMDFVASLIDQLDKPASQVADLKVFKLKSSDATSMQTLLERLFGIQRTGQGAGGQGGAQGQQQAGQVPGVLLADAEDTSSMLIPLRFSTDVRTNSIIAIGGSQALGVVEAVLLRLDDSDIRQRETEVVPLRNSPAANVATAIQQFLQTQQQALTQDPGILSPFEQIEREVIVVPETTTNRLLVSATPRFMKDILEVVKKLDVTPAQVVIQALIVEVKLNNVDEFGMELGLQDSILFRRSPVPAPTTVTSSVTQPNGNVTSTQNIISESATPGYKFNGQQLGNNTFAGVSNPSTIAGQVGTLFNTALTNSQLGFGGLILQAGSENLNFLLRALASRTRVDILSRPLIRTVNNQVSNIQVGQEIPRVTGFTPNAQTGVNSPVVQQRQVGIILQVQSRINPEDGLVIMDVSARKDALSPTSFPLVTNADGTTVNSPIFDTTNALTTVAVRSGQTVVLAGMITKNEQVIERKVPIFGDIPLIGRAFRYDYKQQDRTELLIFLTPRVVRSDEEAEMIKQIEIERLNFIESDAERMNGPLYGMPDFAQPDYNSPSSLLPPPWKPKAESPEGPTLKPTSPPRPPDSHPPKSPATSHRNREPNPMPGLTGGQEREAGYRADDDDDDDDDEDLNAGFVQTSYSAGREAKAPARENKSAAGQPARVKSGSKSPVPAKSARKTTSSAATPLALRTKNEPRQKSNRGESAPQSHSRRSQEDSSEGAP